ncbi:MAG: DUF1648 domain-containing protein [Acidobacteria bacterium]|nr:MAG: DUF1648 domain-containing protein [Acidobacteriota bacterium]REK03933.1 MAG: DUF1648 domain-containing protein [Acidobacteriota bacterium]REK15095.1 MAG: DUF1648 domain-containing protein [Acidobacteriota bacterium]REK46185.1 MAG: DUF1648 domain-containing protein [Acidobacteriota bacterium]
MRTITTYLYVFVAVAAAAHLVLYLPQMPLVMAVHFGPSGSPDGWSSRETFFAISAAIMALNIIVFAFAPWVFQRRRFERINVPNRDYWLSAEHADEFYFLFREKMAWFGIANLIFASVVTHLVFIANSVPEPRLDESLFLALLIGYFVFVISWLFLFFRKILKAGR